MQEKISLPNPQQQDVVAGGPKFKEDVLEKINKAKSNGWSDKVNTFFGDKKNVLAVALLLSTVLIVGLAFSNTNTNDENVALNTAEQSAIENISATDALIQNSAQPVVLGVTSESITVAAVGGSGITHLARTGVQQYITNNDLLLSAEQMVYAEDYLQKLTGNYNLEVGQELSFAMSDVETAVTAAQNLEDWQIQNLSQYVN